MPTASSGSGRGLVGDRNWKVLDESLRKIGDVDCGRILLEGKAKTPNRMLVYIIPGETETAYPAYLARAADWGKYEPLFDEAAARTVGAVRHAGMFEVDPKIAALVLVAAVAVLVGLAIAARKLA